MISSKLTVLFDNPFWVGIFEMEEGDVYKVSKVTFGAEPKDAEVYDFLLRYYYKLKFAKVFMERIDGLKEKKQNPKRLQREIKKEVKQKGIGTKAQIAIKEQYE